MANMDFPGPCWTCGADDSCELPEERDDEAKDAAN